MTKITFETLTFEEEDEDIVISLLEMYYFKIPKKEIQAIGDFKLRDNGIMFKDVGEKTAQNKFNMLLGKYMPILKSKIGNRDALYIHQNSGIPLMGCLAFGIVDKGTDIIEVKPNTGCNMQCVFCSVGEGPKSKLTTDFVVESDYMIEELEKLVKFKQENVHVYINPHGEPLLYADLLNLVRGIRKIRLVDEIHIITSGMLLTKDMIDDLEKKGLTHFNISMSAWDLEKAKEVMGNPAYDVKIIKEIVEYINSKEDLKVVLTPVFMHGINEADIEEIVKFAKELGVPVAIQNFLISKHGRKPAKELSWDDFKKKLNELEKKYDMPLILRDKLAETKEYPLPFKRDDIVRAEIVANGRLPGEKIAMAKGRCILVKDCTRNGVVKVKLARANHNVFVGTEA